MEDCSHDVLVRGLCVTCGAEVHDAGPPSPTAGSGGAKLGDSGLAHLVPGVQMRNKAKFADDDARRVEQARKLYLILDLDETLIHTARGPAPSHARLCDASALSAGAAPDGKTVEMVTLATGHAVLLRPYLLPFLQRMSSLFQISLYTMGGHDYARAILAALDPNNLFFRGGLCAWDDGLTRTRKDLSRLACRRDMVLVVDDTADVWAQDWRSLCLVPRWIGEPTDDALLRVGDHLATVHAAAYAQAARGSHGVLPDVRDTLASTRPSFLTGCVFVFSGLFPRGVPITEHVVCRLVIACGGEVEEELSERSTHLIFRRPRTEKIQRAAAMRRAHGSKPAIVWESWLLACLAMWRLIPEGHMALSASEAAVGAAAPSRSAGPGAAEHTPSLGKRPREASANGAAAAASDTVHSDTHRCDSESVGSGVPSSA